MRTRILFPQRDCEGEGTAACAVPALRSAHQRLRGYVKSGGVRLSMRRPVLPLATCPRRGVGAGGSTVIRGTRCLAADLGALFQGQGKAISSSCGLDTSKKAPQLPLLAAVAEC